MRNEDQRALVHFQRHIQRLDRFHIQVVGRFIHYQNIRFLHHQLTEQHASFFTTGQHFSRFLDIVLAEQQATKEATYYLLIIAFLFPLTHPLEDRQIVFEFVLVILRVVTNLGVFRPFHGTVIRL